MRGFTEIKIGGKKRPLHFGTNQTIKFCEAQGITLNQQEEVYAKMSTGEITGSEVRDLIWSALDDGARIKKIERDFDAETVGDWMDDADQSEMVKAFSALTDSLPKGGSKKKAKAA